MELFDVVELRRRLPEETVGYLEFLRVHSMSAGPYRLPAGSVDPQSPHLEDEVYVVTEGRAVLVVDGERRAVGAGSVAFIAARAQHRFAEITEDLVAVVVFAPPESG
jgi:mannose-6-phosphate isomerase-like protein (cupin superfamily)